MKGKLYTEARAQGDVLNVVKNSTNIKQTSDKLELTATAVYSQKDLKVRYIRDWINGSSSNTSNHWVQITAFKNDVNLALGKTVTGSSVANASWPYTNITDGNFSSGKYGQSNVSGLQWVQVDLGAIVTDLEYVQVFHYYSDGRTYNNSKTEVSADGVTWYPIYDSVIGGTYPETADGRRYYVNDGSFLNRAESKITQTSNKISLVVSDATNTIKGDSLISAINLQPGTVQIQAKNINIQGAVTFSALDTTLQKVTSTGESNMINPNGNLLDWSSTYPTGWQAGSTAAPTRVASDNNTGYAGQYTIASGQTAAWIVQDVNNTPLYDYVTVETTFKLVSGTIDGAGVLFRQNGTAGTIADYKIDFKQLVPTPVLNKWYTITKVLKRNPAGSTDFTGYRLHMMGAWTSFVAPTQKVIQFDSIKTWPSSEAEIKAYESEILTTNWKSGNTTSIDGGKISTGSIDVNSLKAGTIDATKIIVTNMNASNINAGILNASVVSVTNLNASNITTGTLSAARIAANSIVANKLSVGATNLVNDPMVEAIGTTPFDATTVMANNGWSKGAGTATFVDDSTYGRTLKYTNVAGNNSTMFTNAFYVDSTKTYKITFRFRYSKSDDTTPTGSMYFGFNGFNSVTSPSTEVANKGSYEYISDVFSTTGTNPYFYIPNRSQADLTKWMNVEVYLYPPEFYGDRTKLKTPTFPGLSAGTKKVWYMDNKTNMIKLRFLNYNQSTAYGDGTSTNDLYISNLQVTEVDGGTLTATNIVTGVLNADLISINSVASGVTINSTGITATNSTTGVSVTMNSSTGFEIKKSGNTVFTVNSDGSLMAKNIRVNGGIIEGSGLQSISAADVNGYAKYVKVQPTEISVGREKIQNSSPVIRHFIGTTINENNIYSSDSYYNDGQTTSNNVTISQNYLKIQNSFDKQGYSFNGSVVLDVGDYLTRAKLITYGNGFELKSEFDIDITSSNRDVEISAMNGKIIESMGYGSIIKKTLPSVSSQNEVQMDLAPADGSNTGESTGMRLFSRINGMGLYSMGSKNNYTFLKFTPTQGTSKKLTELLGEDVSLYADNTLKTDIKNIFDLRVRDAGNTLRSAMTIDGTKESYGVWVDIGGGSRTVIYAGESNVNPATHLNLSNDSEVLILEANDSLQMYWSTDTLTRSTTKTDFDNTIVGMIGLGGAFRPTVTEKLHLGSTSYRFVTVWAKTTTINSDSRSKHDIQRVRGSKWSEEGFTKRLAKDVVPENRSAEIYEFMKSMPLYQFKYDDMEEHANQFGFIADQLVEYDKNKVASWFINVPEKEEDRLSVSTQSYAAAIHIALQEEIERNDALEKKVEDLEARLLRLEQLLGGQS